MGELGTCAGQYRVMVSDVGGGRFVGELPVESVQWQRVLDATSEASVRVRHAAAPDCCGVLGDIRAWRSELVILRCDQPVWSGPVQTVTYGRDYTTVVARDVTAWLAHRLVHTAHSHPAGTDLSAIANALIADAFAPHDPQVVDYVITSPTGITTERAYAADTGPVLDHLGELAKTGLDWTALGHRIVLGRAPWSRIPALACSDFLGELVVTEDGYASLTRSVVVGSGVTGESGGVHSYYGLLESVEAQDGITTIAAAQTRAKAVLAGAAPNPLIVSPPQGVQLSPLAAVGIDDLVAGALVPVVLECVCRPTRTDLVLRDVTVTAGGGSESVSVTLAPVDIALDA
jgi:hypothetical protein